MPTLTVNDHEIIVEPGTTVLQACEAAGAEIPRFCYHERLAVAGNCRMCLVEVEKAPKPVASCAMPVADGMVVHTDTPLVKKAREGVMEFLLINHPLDCPICDQGGECDLQDQAMAYGAGKSRFQENKRAVPDKDMGPLIKTHMTRCIHCTRCIRFAEDIAGVPELGAIYRGENMQITTYLDQTVKSELSGNVIDLCPVGALTSKPYAFKGRPWELTKTESVDVMDAVGSNIRIDSRGREVMRILPRLHEDINEEWISDKTRFVWDGLKAQRLDRPYIREDGELREAGWQEAFQLIAERMAKAGAKKVGAIAGDLCDAESMFALKSLMDKLGSPHLDCRQDGAALDASVRASYLFNTTIAGIERADKCLLIGTNPRMEASLINARLRKRYLQGGFEVANLGAPADLTYPVEELGDAATLLEKATNSNSKIGKWLKDTANPMLIVGMAALVRPDGAAILKLANEVAEKYDMIRDDWNGFNVLHQAASRVAGLDMGFVPGPSGMTTLEMLSASQQGKLDVLFLLGADEIDMSQIGDCFVIYQGHHGDAGAHRADVILPGAAYTEKDGTYVNTEGRVQRGWRAIFPPGDAREDWKILRALSEVMDYTLPFDTLGQLRDRMEEAVPHFAYIDQIEPGSWQAFGKEGALKNDKLQKSIENFYMTNPISRASRIMAQCTRSNSTSTSMKEAA